MKARGAEGHRRAEEVKETREGGSGFLSNKRLKRAEMAENKDDKEGVGDCRMISPQTAGKKHKREQTKRKCYPSSREK